MDAAHNSHYAQPEEIVTQEELKTMLVKSLEGAQGYRIILL